jgi:hypothetical protein
VRSGTYSEVAQAVERGGWWHRWNEIGGVLTIEVG